LLTDNEHQTMTKAQMDMGQVQVC